MGVAIDGGLTRLVCSSFGDGGALEADNINLIVARNGGWGSNITADGNIGIVNAWGDINANIFTLGSINQILARAGDFNGSIMAGNLGADPIALRTLGAIQGDVNAVLIVNGNVQSIAAIARAGVGGHISGEMMAENLTLLRATQGIDSLDYTGANVTSIIAPMITDSVFDIENNIVSVRAGNVADTGFYAGGDITRFVATGDVTDTDIAAGINVELDLPVDGALGLIYIRGDAHNVDLISQVASGEGAGNDPIWGDGDDVPLGGGSGTIGRIIVGGNITGDALDTYGFLADNGTFTVRSANAGTLTADGAAQLIDGNVLVQVL